MEKICITVCALILFDIITGITAAARNNMLSSAAMREGMYNKMGELMFLGLAVMCQFLLMQPPFDAIGIPHEIMYAVAVYIGGMELLSIIENICKVNPNLPFAKLLELFNIPVDVPDGDMIESESAPSE